MFHPKSIDDSQEKCKKIVFDHSANSHPKCDAFNEMIKIVVCIAYYRKLYSQSLDCIRKGFDR